MVLGHKKNNLGNYNGREKIVGRLRMLTEAAEKSEGI